MRVFVSGIILCIAAGVIAAPATQPVSEAERIEFLQKNVQAQMQELQERMFRLAEITRTAEPTDAAKLVLALRRSREEMIYEQMKDVMDLLQGKDLARAISQEKDVIKKLEKLKALLLATDLDLQLQLERLKKLQSAIAKLDNAIKEEKRQSSKSGEMAKGASTQPGKAATKPSDVVAQLKKDQEQNRKATEGVTQNVKELGDPATSTLPSLSNATGSMSNAEGKLGKGQPGEAQPSQEKATAELQKARDELEQQRQDLLAQMESQIKRQVIENLELMLEKQRSIRETNEVLLPRLKKESREAVVRLKGLAAGETLIAETAESTAQLIEDTEFSFALPPNLRNIQRRAIYITSDFTAGTGDEPVILAEKKIERDLADLLDTFKETAASRQSSKKTSRGRGAKNDRNVLLAELKAVRLLQVRVNEETKELDDHRAQLKQLPRELQDQIGQTRDHQTVVRDTLEKLDAAVTGKPITY